MARPSVFVGMSGTNTKGEKYEVISYLGANNVTVKFSDNTFVKCCAKTVKSGLIKNPNAKCVYGVGFIGQGSYTATVKIDGKTVITPEYVLWNNMLARCYGEASLKRRPSYNGCTVSPIWHNFQTFAEWVNTQKFFNKRDPSLGIRGYCLDKDLLFSNNTIYSPETCCLLPNSLNVAINTTTSYGDGSLPQGVNLKKSSGKYGAAYSNKGVTKHLGYFKDKHEAFKVYREAKTNYIKLLAEEYKDVISPQAYEALLKYEVTMTET